MGDERRVLTRREQRRVDAERLLIRLLLRRAVCVEHEQLCGRRRRAEGERPAAALRIAGYAVQNAAGELAFAHEHAAELHRAGRLIEVGLVGPRDAVDVEDGEVLVAVDVLEALQLADTLVAGAGELHGLYLTWLVEGDVAGAVSVVEEARAEEQPLLAVRDVRRLHPEQWMLRALFPVFEQRPPEHRLLARLRVTLVENDVAGRVAVAEHGARVIARPRHGVGTVHALAENLRLAGREVDPYAEELRLLARLGKGVAGRRLLVHVHEMRPHPAEDILVQWLGEASV